MDLNLKLYASYQQIAAIIEISVSSLMTVDGGAS